jgi:tetratricopeptide (TPR) repeat protein
MKQHPPQPKHARGLNATEAEKKNSFALAAAALATQRQIRNIRVRQIAAQLQEKGHALAQKELREHLAEYPRDADALKLLAQIAVGFGRRREALSLLERCLALAPDFLAARFNYANLLSQLNKFQAALHELDTLLAEDGDNPLFRHLKANIFESIGETAQSLAIFEDLAARNPGRAESWVSYGHALRAMGLPQKSIAAYRKAIECRPSFGSAYWSLANMKTARFGDAEIAAMRELLNRTDISPDDRVTLQFSLGKACEDQGAYEQAFEQYAKANAAVRLRAAYDPEALTKSVAANKALFTPAFLESRRDAGCKAADPIFILGRPRSGSTLIEQILSSHSAIEGTAELPYITALAGRLEGRDGPIPYGTDYLKPLGQLDAAALSDLGEEYLADTRVHRKLDRPFFIDKKPANFSHIGMIQLILPNAKIIDARRHPAATAVSMFKTYSSKSSLRLAELGRYYRDYVALMAHFDRVLPGRIHRVIYEDMVANPEAEVRRLLDYLGLPFEEGCLRFYETERTVLTPSSEQVRKPISGDAVDYWRNFEPWLDPLIRSLGTALTEYPSVPEELR